MFSWFAKFLAHPLRVGAIAPSSSFLARLMTEGISPESRVLEIGPGNGAITPFILKRLASPSQLTLIEIDHEFAEKCRTGFPGTRVIEGDITNVLTQQPDSYDVVVSGVPFGAMEKKLAESIFKIIRDRLNNGGQFIMFQYSVRTLQEVRNVFENAILKFTLWNLPPAFVFVATKKEKRPDEIALAGRLET